MKLLDDRDSGGAIGTTGGSTNPTVIAPKWLDINWTHADNNPSALVGFRLVIYTGSDPNNTANYVFPPFEFSAAERRFVKSVTLASTATLMSAVQSLYTNGNESSWRVLGGGVVIDPDTVVVGKQVDVAAAASNASTAIVLADGSQISGSLSRPIELWSNLNGHSVVTLVDGKEGSVAVRMSTAAFFDDGMYHPVDATRKYKTHFWARAASGTNGILYFNLRQFSDNLGTPCGVNGGRSPYYPSGVPAHTGWVLYEHIWSGTDFQSGVKFVKPEWLGNYTGTVGYWEVQGFRWWDVTDSDNAQVTGDQINSVYYLSNQDKIQLRRDWDAEQLIKTQLDAQASALGVSSTTYDSAVAALSTNLINAGAPSGWATTWPDGVSFGSAVEIINYLRGWWSSISSARAGLQKVIGDTINNAAAYADSLSRSSNNLVKNGNSEFANPTGYEANGISSGLAHTGTKSRYFAGVGYWAGIQVTPNIPCNPGDHLYASCWTVVNSGGTTAIMARYLDASGTTIDAANLCTSTGTGGWQFMQGSVVVPAGTSFFSIELRSNAPNGYSCYFDEIFACRKISAGMLEADLGIFGVIRSGGDSSGTGLYVPGSTGNAPVGFKVSAFPFTCTYIDGTSDATCQMELGGSANFGGYRVATVNTRAMTAFNRINNGNFYKRVNPWIWVNGVGVLGISAQSQSAGTGSAAIVASATTSSGNITKTDDLVQTFNCPPSSQQLSLNWSVGTTGSNVSGDGGTASASLYLFNHATGVETLIDSWSQTLTAQISTVTWSNRTANVSSYLAGGGEFSVRVAMTATANAATAGTNSVTTYLDSVSCSI